MGRLRLSTAIPDYAGIPTVLPYDAVVLASSRWIPAYAGRTVAMDAGKDGRYLYGQTVSCRYPALSRRKTSMA